MSRREEVTLRKDCKCACHATPNAAVVHVHPCCGPGSEGWPDIALPDEDPYKALSLFGNKESQSANVSTSDKSSAHKS